MPRHLRRPRPSDPWFDSECRQAKRLTRRLERASVAAGPLSFLPTPSPPPVPPLLRRHGPVSGVYIAFCDIVRALSFGAASSRLISQIQKSCGDQWTSYSDVAVFLRVLLSTSRRFFTEKVQKVRSSTKDAPTAYFQCSASWSDFYCFTAANSR